MPQGSNVNPRAANRKSASPDQIQSGRPGVAFNSSDFGVFGDWPRRGFGPDLIPIIPPGGKLSPYSKLTPDKAGKTPGDPECFDGGQFAWRGLVGWTQLTITPAVLSIWAQT